MDALGATQAFVCFLDSREITKTKALQISFRAVMVWIGT